MRQMNLSRLMNVKYDFDARARIVEINFMPHSKKITRDVRRAILEVFPEVSMPVENGECLVMTPLPDEIVDVDQWIMKKVTDIVDAFDRHDKNYRSLD